MLREGKESGVYKGKSTRLLKFLTRIMIDSDARKEIFVLKG